MTLIVIEVIPPSVYSDSRRLMVVVVGRPTREHDKPLDLEVFAYKSTRHLIVFFPTLAYIII